MTTHDQDMNAHFDAGREAMLYQMDSDEEWNRRNRHRFLRHGWLPGDDEAVAPRPKPHAGISDPESWED